MTTNSIVGEFNYLREADKRGLLYAKDGILYFEGNSEASAATLSDLINVRTFARCVKQGENFALLSSDRDNKEVKFRMYYNLTDGLIFEWQSDASFWDFAKCLAAKLSKIKLVA